MTSDHLSTWDEARRLADEVAVQIHLATMDARDRWHHLEPRIGELEKKIAHSGEQVGDVVVHEVHEVRDALRALRDDVIAHARGDYAKGW